MILIRVVITKRNYRIVRFVVSLFNKICFTLTIFFWLNLFITYNHPLHRCKCISIFIFLKILNTSVAIFRFIYTLFKHRYRLALSSETLFSHWNWTVGYIKNVHADILSSITFLNNLISKRPNTTPSRAPV